MNTRNDSKMGEQKFLKIKEASIRTGLSQYYLRNGCKNGTVPHIKSGNNYYIDIEELFKSLRA